MFCLLLFFSGICSEAEVCEQVYSEKRRNDMDLVKKGVVLWLAILALAACGGGGGSGSASRAASPASSDENQSIVMITDTGGLGDGGFNDTAWHGLEMVRDELGFKIGIIESTEAAQYAPNIAQAAEQGYNIVVCVGFLFVDVLAEVAPQYPDTKFIMIDGEVAGSNVYSFTFEVQESSYLAGALAALVCKENIFGHVGGMEIPDTLAWESGYVAGIKTVKPNAEVKTAYVGTFADPGRAKELALAQFNAGAVAVMEVSSGGAIGVIEAARDAGKLFISSDKSKDVFAPGFELTSATAKRDYAILNAVKMIYDGTAKPGKTNLSTKDGIFGLPENTGERYGAETLAVINKLQEMIVRGELVVPNTREKVNSFTAPKL
jgi:basic membrane protein A